ncbi:MAG: hypothetical protein AB7I27_00250 [Bacteriovoracaceae bacterium]
MRLLLSLIFLVSLISCNSSNGSQESKSSAPDAHFLNLETAVQRSSGSVSGYGFSLKGFLDTIAKTGAKTEWVADKADVWVLKITLDDPATNSSNEMSFSFKKIGNQAAVIRYVDNGNEIPAYNLGVTVDQVLTPFSKMIQSK